MLWKIIEDSETRASYELALQPGMGVYEVRLRLVNGGWQAEAWHRPHGPYQGVGKTKKLAFKRAVAGLRAHLVRRVAIHEELLSAAKWSVGVLETEAPC